MAVNAQQVKFESDYGFKVSGIELKDDGSLTAASLRGGDLLVSGTTVSAQGTNKTITITPTGTGIVNVVGTLVATQFIGAGTSAALGDTPPLSPAPLPGALWFNTNTGKLYVYYNDGNSSQWVQPMTPSVGGAGGIGGGSGIVSTGSAGKLAYYPVSGTTIDDLAEVYWHSHGGTSMLHIDGLLEVSGQKNKIRFHWDTLADLNSEANPSTWHGMIAHVHETGRVYFAHSGAWSPLANLADITSPTVTNIVAGDNVTISNVSGVFTINAVTGTGGGGITLEESQDGTATLFHNGTHVGITYNYVDASNALSLAVDSSVVALLTSTQTLTNKTISGANNTLTNIGNASLTNSSITINGTAVSLGGSITVSGGAAGNLDSLTDVVITSPTLNQVLKYNGTNWVNDTGAAGNLDSLTDVVITSPTLNQVLKYNGTNWVNDTDATSGGGGSSNSFETIAVAGQTSVVADSSTDTLTLVAGTGITITTVAGTDTITIASSGATVFTGLTDISTAGLTVDKIYMPAITMLDVTANGTTAFRFDQYGSVDDPTIYAISGTTIAFNLAGAPGHPFLLRTSGGVNYNTGLVHVSTTGVVSTGASAQGKSSGTLYWKIPADSAGAGSVNYQYICQSHSSMVGVITVKDIGVI